MKRHSIRGCLVAILWALVAWLPTPSQGADVSQSAPGQQPSGIRWASSFEAAREQAGIEGRLIMVDFYTAWCGWCKRLDRETYVDSSVVHRSQQLVAVKVDAEKRPELARRYGVRAYPTIWFLRPDGTEFEMIRGYQAPNAFASTLNRILDTKGEEFTLRQRLRDHPELTSIRQDLAMLLLRRGDDVGALGQLDSLLALAKDLPEDDQWDLRLTRGRALVRAGRAEEARKELEKFVKKRKDSPRIDEAIFFLAEASRAEGDRGKARKWYRKLLEMSPAGWLAEQSKARLADLG